MKTLLQYLVTLSVVQTSEAAPGTIRGDLGLTVGRNIIHGSDSVESAQREIKLWFSSNEIADTLHQEKIGYTNKNI